MGVVHSTVSRGNLKLAFVDRAPYIFANLGFKDGIRERAIEQFASAPLEKHNRNSIAICTPGTDLNDAMMAMTSFDDLSDPLLRRFVFRIRLAPLNDELGEGPHSQFSKEHSHANRATFSFKSATVRLKPNLEDIENFSCATEADVQSLYDNYKQCVQVSQ